MTSVTYFGQVVATDHNAQVPAYFPRMYSYMQNRDLTEKGDDP